MSSSITARKFRTSGRSDIFRATGLRITDSGIILPNGVEVDGAGGGGAESLTGDVTGSLVGTDIATAIGAGKVTMAKLANLAASTLIGRISGSGAGVPVALTLGSGLAISAGGVLDTAGGSGASYAAVSFTEVQLEDLANTPIQIVATPGAGFYIIPIWFGVELKFTAGYSSSPFYRIRWSTVDSPLLMNQQITSTATGTQFFGLANILGGSPFGFGLSGAVDPVNKGLFLTANANPGTPLSGAGTGKVHCIYVTATAVP